MSGPPEQEGGQRGRQPPPQIFFVDVPFFRRALEMSFLKEVTKNVHEN